MNRRTSPARTLRMTAAAVAVSASAAAGQVPSPASHLGFEIGTDRRLADWTELTSYYERLAATSGRVSVDTLGTTTRGRPFVMVTVTSPENHARLDRLHEIQMRLSDPRRVSSQADLELLLEEGRAVVLITHGIHATEVGSSQSAARLLHALASSNEPEVLEILDNVILLDIPSLNPDGLQWMVDHYESTVGTRHEGATLPWLYQFYTGHDNNRDWYAFTQDETRHTVTGAHNAWHPQIVHDIHQMGGGGARIFFPPYIDPWEPNVDPALTSAVSQLGSWMAADLINQGKDGVVINAIYDAFSPARSYQHYHAGARILSETASANLASPVTVPPERIGGGRNYDAATASWNYPRPWRGGEWGLPQIVDYQASGALSLLKNAARNRRFWLENSYGVNQRAVQKWDEWPEAWVIPSDQGNRAGVDYVLRILALGDVEVHRARVGFEADGRLFPAGSWVVPMRQPYASFAQTLLEVQEYPDLRQYPGGPPQAPYDVTAHTLPLLMDVEAVALEEPVEAALSEPIEAPALSFVLPDDLVGPDAPRIAMYKGWQEPMEAGWTRWVFDQHGLRYDTLHNADVARGDLGARYDVILFQSQDPESIVEGFSAEEMPPRYQGGIGDAGRRALREFVRGGGRLVAIEEATELAVELFDLGVTNAVDRLPPAEFYVPGSILRLQLEEGGPLAQGRDPETVAWYWRSSRAFDLSDPTVDVWARYGDLGPLLSGWILGPRYLAGQPAVVKADVGRGSVVLFGFQPNYRGQTVATWPLLFEALSISDETSGGR
ncbi:MAG: hypothetical protein KY453_06890 [Gemmatimonadetes bacterium]|nr:hypothetical protein [Gemmatimonadota bacterium]